MSGEGFPDEKEAGQGGHHPVGWMFSEVRDYVHLIVSHPCPCHIPDSEQAFHVLLRGSVSSRHRHRGSQDLETEELVGQLVCLGMVISRVRWRGA